MSLCHNFSKQFFPFNSQFGYCYKKQKKEHKYSQQNSKLKGKTEFYLIESTGNFYEGC